MIETSKTGLEYHFAMMTSHTDEHVQIVERPHEHYASARIPDTLTASEVAHFLNQPMAQQMIISPVIGRNEVDRVNHHNPAAVITGFIADFDEVAFLPESDEEITELLQKHAPTGLLPYAWYRSFSGRGIHVIYVFARPVPSPQGNLFAKEFMSYGLRKLGTRTLLGNSFDPRSAEPTQYFHSYNQWHVLGGEVPAAALSAWEEAVYRRLERKGEFDAPRAGREIPWKELGEHLSSRYPYSNIDPGNFGQNGKRYVRFWDPSADNESSVSVYPEGLYTYTGGVKFKPWRALCTHSFLEGYTQERMHSATEPYYYADPHYFKVDGEGDTRRVRRIGGEQLKRALIKQGISPKTEAAQSELTDALYRIETTKRVDSVAPFIWTRRLVVSEDGIDSLNSSSLTVPRMSPDPVTLADLPRLAPLTYRSMLNMSGLAGGGSHVAWSQWYSMTYWQGYFWRGFVDEDPRIGSAAVILGSPGTGKNYFSTCLLPLLFGLNKAEDPTASLLEKSDQYTGQILENPVWAINDPVSASPRRFNARLKGIIANGEVRHREMQRNPISMKFYGRIVVGLNDSSSEFLPSAANHMIDKTNLWRFEWPITWIESEIEHRVQLEAEMYYWRRFLYDLAGEIPPEWRDPRWGVRVWHHPDLEEFVAEIGDYQHIVDLVKAGPLIDRGVRAGEAWALYSTDPMTQADCQRIGRSGFLAALRAMKKDPTYGQWVRYHSAAAKYWFIKDPEPGESDSI